jgi:hypothetical protein
VPVTVKLSERFYHKFGHELVDEMVNWFNQLDTTYRSELRELNDLNFARFDAKLEQRLAEVKADLRQELAQVRVELRQGIAEIRTELLTALAAQRTELLTAQGGLRGELIKWMFVFWIGQAATTVGLVLAVVRLS